MLEPGRVSGFAELNYGYMLILPLLAGYKLAGPILEPHSSRCLSSGWSEEHIWHSACHTGQQRQWSYGVPSVYHRLLWQAALQHCLSSWPQVVFGKSWSQLLQYGQCVDHQQRLDWFLQVANGQLHPFVSLERLQACLSLLVLIFW